MKIIGAQDILAQHDWGKLIAALRQGHLHSRHREERLLLGDEHFAVFSRAVIIPGQGAGVKVVSIFPENRLATPPGPTDQSMFLVIDEQSKAISAVLDGPAITWCKTAADSALAASILSRADSEVLLVLGAGAIARSLVEAHLHVRPGIRKVLLWNRTLSRLPALQATLEQSGVQASIVTDLDAALTQADIVTSATASNTALIKGALVRPGTHIDLVGSFRNDMRESDDLLMLRSRIFVDDRDSALCSGDLSLPIASGVINAACIEADLYELCQATDFQRAPDDITTYKNGGGAHLDLMISRQVIAHLNASQPVALHASSRTG